MKHTRGRAIRMAASRWGFTSRRPRERDAELEAHPADARDARALVPDASKRRATRRGRARERDGEKAVGRARLPLGFGGWERVERAVVRRQGDAGR